MRGALIGLGLFVAGCAAPAMAPPALAPVAAPVAAPAPDLRPRLWYVGLGLFGESWSQNDVANCPPN